MLKSGDHKAGARVKELQLTLTGYSVEDVFACGHNWSQRMKSLKLLEYYLLSKKLFQKKQISILLNRKTMASM